MIIKSPAHEEWRPRPARDRTVALGDTQRALGKPDPEKGLFLATSSPTHLFKQTGPVFGAEVAFLQVATDWLEQAAVQRWYYFPNTTTSTALDAPPATTFAHHLHDTLQIAPAAGIEAGRLMAGGFIHALVSAGPMWAQHLAMRQTQYERNVPSIGFIHSLNDDDLAWLMGVGAPTFPFDLIFSPSECGKRAFLASIDALQARVGQRAYRGEVQVIPYGVPIGEELPRNARQRLRWRDDDIVFLSIARFDKRRKYDPAPLIGVFAKLLEEEPRARLVLAGSTTQMEEVEALEGLCAGLGISQRVELRPNFPSRDKLMFLAGADVFVSFGDHFQETYGVALVEAMAVGLPIVASDWSGYKEIVVDGETGCLVPVLSLPPDDEVLVAESLRRQFRAYPFAIDSTVIDLRAALAALRELCASPERRHAMGQAGKQRAVALYDKDKNHARMFAAVQASVREAGKLPVQAFGGRIVDWQKRYADYPTGWLGGDARVEHGLLVDRAQTLVADAVWHALLAATPDTLDALALGLSARFSDLSAAAARRRIVQLAKYGYLQLR